ncbi:TolC family protein [Spirochaeta thermophila]|nr:TolC family protein [Spirochaeta thermophila]
MRRGVPFLLLLLLPGAVRADGFRSFLEAALASSQGEALEAAQAAREAALREQRASLLPGVGLSVPLEVQDEVVAHSEMEELGPVDVRHRVSVVPGVGLTASQLLPTGGTLAGSLQGSSSYSDVGEVEPEAAASLPGYSIEPARSLSFTAGLSLSQPLVTGVFRAVQDQLRLREEEAALSSLSARNELVRAAAEDYFHLLVLAYQRQLAEERMKATVARAERIERESALGLWTRTALLQSRAEAEREKLAFEEAEAVYREFASYVQEAYGLTAFPGEGELAPFPAPGLTVEEVVARSPEVRRASVAAGLERAGVVLVRRDAAPSIEVSLGASHSRSLDEDEYTTGLQGSVSLSLRLADGGAAAGRIEAAEARARRAEAECATVQAGVRMRAASLLGKIARYERQREVDAMLVEAARMELEVAERDLEAGRTTVHAVQEKKLALDRALLEAFQHTVDYNLAVLEVWSLAGYDLVDLVRSGFTGRGEARR